jgi:NAD+ synthase
MNNNYCKTAKKILTQRINTFFKDKPTNSIAVVGISGGKDSTITAKLLVDTLGVDRVLGVLMPNGKGKQDSDAYKVVEYLGIKWKEIDISPMYNEFVKSFDDCTEPMLQNLAPRLRMTTLYAVAQNSKVPAFVVNTCNMSETFVGYATKWGDNVGDFEVLGDMLVTDILKLGDYLGVPYELVHKIPSDGLCGKSDEENLGVTYEAIDNYINGKMELLTEEEKERIKHLHEANKHKKFSMEI